MLNRKLKLVYIVTIYVGVVYACPFMTKCLMPKKQKLCHFSYAHDGNYYLVRSRSSELLCSIGVLGPLQCGSSLTRNEKVSLESRAICVDIGTSCEYDTEVNDR